MGTEIRFITDAELAGFDECQSIAMVREPRDREGVERRRAIQEIDRSIAAFDGGQVVGTASAFTRTLTTPGGSAPMGGLTMVSVRSTHRRQGILTEMMRQHFADCLGRGEALSGLYAAEAPIYGRFGYGIAAQHAELRIERAHARLEHLPEIRGRMRMIGQDEAREQWPTVWDTLRPKQPGMLNRPTSWWPRVFHDPAEERAGLSSLRFVNYEVDGEILGYVLFRQKNDWKEGLPNCALKVQELIATSPEAYAALWQYLFSVDWMATIEGEMFAADEPLYHMLLDERRLRRTVDDGVWLRILDVNRALEARTYGCDGELTFVVDDPFLPEVGGAFLLVGGPGGAACRRTEITRGAIRLGIAELSAIYLGGTRLSTLVRAGRVTGDAEEIRLAEMMFSSDPPPWCPEMF